MPDTIRILQIYFWLQVFAMLFDWTAEWTFLLFVHQEMARGPRKKVELCIFDLS